MDKNKDTKVEMKKEIKTEVVKPKPKQQRTVEEIKLVFQELEALDKLMAEINGAEVDFYTKQNTAIYALPLRPTIIPVEIRGKVFNYLRDEILNKKDALTKIITGE